MLWLPACFVSSTKASIWLRRSSIITLATDAKIEKENEGKRENIAA
jgi:hypothetical protein